MASVPSTLRWAEECSPGMPPVVVITCPPLVPRIVVPVVVVVDGEPEDRDLRQIGGGEGWNVSRPPATRSRGFAAVGDGAGAKRLKTMLLKAPELT